MNKAQFVEAVALDANLTKVEARKAIDAMIRVTVQALREGGTADADRSGKL